MSNHGKNHQKHSPAVTNFIKLLYANKVTALALHFSVNALIAIIFAIVFTLQLNLGYTGFKILLVAMLSGSIYMSIKSCINNPAYTGYLVNFMGTHTEVVLRDGFWPMFLYPLIRLEPHEAVDFQKKDIKIGPHTLFDGDGNPWSVSGTITWAVTEEGAATFTKSTMETFLDIGKLSGENAATTVASSETFFSNESAIRDLNKFNSLVLKKIDTEDFIEQYGVEIKKPYLKLTPLAETERTFAIKGKTLQEVLANKTKGMGLAQLLGDFKDRLDTLGLKYTDKEVNETVLKAINGVYIYDFGSGGGGGHKFLNISPKMPKS